MKIKALYFRTEHKHMAIDDSDQEQMFPKHGKRVRYYRAAKQYGRSRKAAKNALSENLHQLSRDYYGTAPQSSDPFSSDAILQVNDKYDLLYNQRQKARKKKTSPQDYQPPIFKLGVDELEKVTSYLDTKSAINLLCTCKEINQKLSGCSGFWHGLCVNENFHEYSALKLDDAMKNQILRSKNTTSSGLDELSSGDESEKVVKIEEKLSEEVSSKNMSVIGNATRKIHCGLLRKDERLCWSGEKFHDVKLPKNATLWHKIYLRGMQMRRNICEGRFELWRLFLTGENRLPVKKMMFNTTFRELRYLFKE